MNENEIRKLTATILATAADGLSDVVYTEGRAIGALILPAAWTAATITVRKGLTAAALYEAGDRFDTAYSVTVTAGRWVDLPADEFKLCRYIQLRSGTAAVPVQQAEDREIEIVTYPL